MPSMPSLRIMPCKQSYARCEFSDADSLWAPEADERWNREQPVQRMTPLRGSPWGPVTAREGGLLADLQSTTAEETHQFASCSDEVAPARSWKARAGQAAARLSTAVASRRHRSQYQGQMDADADTTAQHSSPWAPLEQAKQVRAKLDAELCAGKSACPREARLLEALGSMTSDCSRSAAPGSLVESKSAELWPSPWPEAAQTAADSVQAIFEAKLQKDESMVAATGSPWDGTGNPWATSLWPEKAQSKADELAKLPSNELRRLLTEISQRRPEDVRAVMGAMSDVSTTDLSSEASGEGSVQTSPPLAPKTSPWALMSTFRGSRPQKLREDESSALVWPTAR